jgi:hypothetical protein
MPSIAVLLLIACVARGAAWGDASADFAGPGGCGVDPATTFVPLRLPPESGCGRDCALKLHIVGPTGPPPSQRPHRAPAAGGADPGPGPGCAPPASGWPLLFFYPGFQLRAGFYDNYAARLASWGWVVVRYDLELLDLVPAAVEVKGAGAVAAGAVKCVGHGAMSAGRERRRGAVPLLRPSSTPQPHPPSRPPPTPPPSNLQPPKAGYLPHILAKLAEVNADSGSPWHGRLDLSRLAAAGHR